MYSASNADGIDRGLQQELVLGATAGDHDVADQTFSSAMCFSTLAEASATGRDGGGGLAQGLAPGHVELEQLDDGCAADHQHLARSHGFGTQRADMRIDPALRDHRPVGEAGTQRPHPTAKTPPPSLPATAPNQGP